MSALSLLCFVRQVWEGVCRVTLTLGGCLAVAVALTRSVLPRSLRFLANNSSAELFQLTVLAFCLVNAWISGYLVTPLLHPPAPPASCPPASPSCLYWHSLYGGVKSMLPMIHSYQSKVSA